VSAARIWFALILRSDATGGVRSPSGGALWQLAQKLS
jgi:hypothetical protein